MINQLTKRDKLRGGTGLNRCAGEDGKWDGLWINGGATCSVRLEMGMCPLHELTSSAEGLLHNKDISLLFIYIDFPVKCVLALGIPTELGRKISFFPQRVKKSWVMNLVFSEKRDRSRGLAVHCLLERKNWKCIIKREENIKVSETEKLWLGGAMCKKKIEQKTDWWGQCCQRDYYLREWNLILHLFRAAVLQTGASDTKTWQA